MRRLRAAFSSHTKGCMLSAASDAEMFLIGTAYWMVVTQPIKSSLLESTTISDTKPEYVRG